MDTQLVATTHKPFVSTLFCLLEILEVLERKKCRAVRPTQLVSSPEIYMNKDKQRNQVGKWMINLPDDRGWREDNRLRGLNHHSFR